jgi:hypothetical protein
MEDSLILGQHFFDLVQGRKHFAVFGVDLKMRVLHP